MNKRSSTRKYDQQSFPDILDAIKNGKYNVKKPTGPKYKQKDTWEKWRLIFDEAEEVIKDFFYCIRCSSIYNLKLANSGRCLRTHAIECVGPSDEENHINDHFSLVFQPTKKKKISQPDKLAVKEAAIEFIVKDMRPIRAVKGDGLHRLLSNFTAIGAKYGAMSVKDLVESKLVPSQSTVRHQLNRCCIVYL